MAEDLRATRPIKGTSQAASDGGAATPTGEVPRGPGGEGGATGASDEARRERHERFASELSGQELSARMPRVTLDGDEAAHPTPVRRWSSRAHSVPEIERELNRIWGSAALRSGQDGEQHVAARSSVLNLVVVAGRQEVAEKCAATIARLAGRHPSRSMILSAVDVDGPPGLDAQIEAHCVLPASGTAETCAEMIYITTRGDTSRHLAAIIVPLLVHDLPVALWWPHEPQFRSHRADRLLPMADRLIVDGSSWSGNGLERLSEMALVAQHRDIVVADFALIRQARWREAIASVFDLPDLRPYLWSIRSMTVEYASADKSDLDGLTNVVKPVYHVAWLASRLGMDVVERLHHDGDGRRVATLRQRDHEVEVMLRPVKSDMPPGTTLRVEMTARRLGHDLVGDVTAEQQTVDVLISEDGRERVRRSFLAPRKADVDQLGDAVEETAPDPIAVETLQMANCLITADPMPRRRGTGRRLRRTAGSVEPEPKPESESQPAADGPGRPADAADGGSKA